MVTRKVIRLSNLQQF